MISRSRAITPAGLGCISAAEIVVSDELGDR
jgi:hypothetical protein